MILSIQFLRFLAAALVVLTHVRIEIDKSVPESIVSFGDFGVDIFFVISGFIMSHITQRDSAYFLTRRLIRIVPLYWAFTLLLSAITFVLPELFNSARFDPGHILASLLFLPYWTEAAGFKPILLLGWTLNFEMYFYVLFFIAMKVSHRAREAVCSLLLLLVLLVLNMPLGLDPTHPILFYADTISCEFIFGMLLAVLWRNLPGGRSGLPDIIALLLVLLCAAAFVISSFSPGIQAELPRFVFWGLPALLLVLSGLSLERHFRQLSAALQKLILLLGEISYPMYLIHIYFIALLSRVFGLTSLGVTTLFLVSLVLTSVASQLALMMYDVPLRRRLMQRFVDKRPARAASRAG